MQQALYTSVVQCRNIERVYYYVQSQQRVACGDLQSYIGAGQMTEEASWCRQTLDDKTRQDLKGNSKSGQDLQAVGISYIIVHLDFEIN